MKNEVNNETNEIKQNRAVSFLKRIFIENIGYKFLALFSGFLVWLLISMAVL